MATHRIRAPRAKRIPVIPCLPGGVKFKPTGWIAQWLFGQYPELFPVMEKPGQEGKPADRTVDYWYRKADRPRLLANGGDPTLGGIVYDPNAGSAFDDTNQYRKSVYPTREAALERLEKMVNGRIARLNKQLAEEFAREFPGLDPR